MDMHIAVDASGRFLRCTVTAQATPENAQQLLQRFQEGAEGTVHTRLLLDLMAVTGELALPQQHQMGVGLAETFRKFSRVAVVQKPRTNNGFGALVAKNRGLKIDVFATEAEAISWLTR
jgi:hypothetical protein